jgi:uncharacterized protein YjiS (DUF1127 family)
MTGEREQQRKMGRSRASRVADTTLSAGLRYARAERRTAMIRTANDRQNSCVGLDVHCDRHAAPPSLVVGVALNALSTVRTWRARARFRRALAARNDYELQDMGTCWSSISDEVSKPFWRA